MFTGIVTDIGRVRAVTPPAQGRDTRLVIETAYETAAIDTGASISCAGCCLTVVEKGPGWFAVDASGETSHDGVTKGLTTTTDDGSDKTLGRKIL